MKKGTLLLYFLFVAMSILSLHSKAQVVNVESARMQSDTTGWMGGANVSLNLTKSVDKVFGLNADAHLQYKTKNDKSLWLILINYGYLKGGGVKYISNRYAHFRYNWKVTSWLRGEAFTQIQSNLITQIAERFLVGAGPRFKIVKTKTLRLYAATSAMFEYEKQATQPPIYLNGLRSSSYVSFTFTPRDNIEVVSTTYFQPLFKNLKNYRVLNEINAMVKATKHFSMSLKWDYLYDQYPAGTSPQTNYSIAAGIQFEL